MQKSNLKTVSIELRFRENRFNIAEFHLQRNTKLGK